MSLQNEWFRIDFSWALLTSPFRAAKGEIFILTDCICSAYQSPVVQLPDLWTLPPPFPASRPLVCSQVSMRQLKGLTPPCPLQHCGQMARPRITVSLRLDTAAHKIRHKTWQQAVLTPTNKLAPNQWSWIEGCHILPVTLSPTVGAKMKSDSQYRRHIKRRRWEKNDYLLLKSVIDMLWNSFHSQRDLLIQFMEYKFLSNMCLP